MSTPRAGIGRHLALSLGLVGALGWAAPLDVAPLTLGPRAGVRSGVDATAVGARVVVTWVEETRQGTLPMVLTTDEAGVIVGAPRLLSRQRAISAPRVAGGSSAALAVWLEQGPAGAVVVARRLADDGTSPDAAARVLTTGIDTATAPAVTWLGMAWLIAWTDQAPGGGGSRVRALRVGADGAPLDGAALVVASAMHRLTSVAVAAAGGPALLAWEDWGTGTQADVHAARVSAAGAVLDATPVSLAATTVSEVAPSVGAMASGYYVAWEARVGAQADLRGQLLDAQGQPSGASTTLMGTPASEGAPRVTPLGSTYLVLATQADSLYVSRVSGGALLDAVGTNSQYLFRFGNEGAARAEGGALVPTSAGGRGVFLTGLGGSVSLRHRALLADGRVSGVTTALPTGRVDQRAPRATATTSGHVVAWCEAAMAPGNSDVLARLLGPTGGALSPAPWPVASSALPECEPVLAWGGASLHAVWEVLDPPRRGHLGRRFTEAGTPLGAGTHWLTPGSSSSFERNATVSWVGDESYVAYEAVESDAVWGVRIDASGQPQFLPGGDVALSTEPLAREPTSTCLSGQHVVAWVEPARLRATRVSAAGQPLDTPPLVLIEDAPGVAQPRLTTDGTALLLSWAEPRDGRWQLFARRFAADGGALGPEVTLTDPGAMPREHAVAFDGTGYQVAWVDARLGRGEVLARRLDAQGALDGPNPSRLVGADGGNDDDRRSLSLSCSGGACLAFFESSGLDDEGAFTRARAQPLPGGNQAPSALAVTGALDAGTAITLTLGGSDPEGSPLTYRLVRAPRIGRLAWTPPTVTYAVDEGPSSRDDFFYVTDDGALQSAPARVVLTIRPTPIGVASDGGVDAGVEFDAGVPARPDGGTPPTLGAPAPVTRTATAVSRRAVRDASGGCSGAPFGLAAWVALAWLRRRRVRAGARWR